MIKKIIFTVFIIVALCVLAILGYEIWMKEKVKSELKLFHQVHYNFSAYINARAKMVEFSCTKHLATFQGITLSSGYLSKQKTVDNSVINTEKSLHQSLNNAKGAFGGDVAKFSNDTLQFIKKHGGILRASNVTRGFCQAYKAGMIDKVVKNIERYQVSPRAFYKGSNTVNKAIYVGKHGSISKITSNIDKKELPTTLLLGGKHYPIQCHYDRVQPIEKAIGINKPVANKSVYQTSRYFYSHQSPQINAILQCETKAPISQLPSFHVGDTYPWYKPTVIGSHGQPAAGDVMESFNHQQLVIVLGHEPCVCNAGDKSQCMKVKSLSRTFNELYWQLLQAFESEKNKHSPKAKTAINSFAVWSQDEMKKDFCYINKHAMNRHIYQMIEQIVDADKQAGIQPRSIRVASQPKININSKKG
jgi:hypothetical protein